MRFVDPDGMSPRDGRTDLEAAEVEAREIQARNEGESITDATVKAKEEEITGELGGGNGPPGTKPIVLRGDHTARVSKIKKQGEKPIFTIKNFFEYIRKGGALYSLGGEVVPRPVVTAGLTTLLDMIVNGDDKDKVKEDFYDFIKDFALDKSFELLGSENPIGIATEFYIQYCSDLFCCFYSLLLYLRGLILFIIG